MANTRKEKKENTARIRAGIKQFYINKFYNLFINHYKFKGVTDQQDEFIKRKMWADGRLWAFIAEGTGATGNEELDQNLTNPEGVIVFCPFAPFTYNVYDYPIQVTLINNRGVSFIPDTPQTNNIDGVIGYAERGRKPIALSMEFFINKIVDIEMTIRLQLKAHKTPLLIKTTPENAEKMERFNSRVDNDESVIYISEEEAGATENLNISNPFIIDKLRAYEQDIINDALTYLGINNNGAMEKKEHLIGDEVNSNNELIQESGDCVYDCFKEFTEAIREVLGYNIDVEVKQYKAETEAEETQEDDQDE